MSQDLAVKPAEKIRNLMSVVEARKDVFRELLPKYLTPEKLFRVAQLAMSKHPLLLQCTPASFVVAMMDAARSGLEPDGKQAALVPYGNQVQFQPMYQGMVKQAVREGAAKKIAARVVHSHDRFSIRFDPEPHLEHEPALEDEGEIIGAYAYAILPDDSLQIEWMNKRQLDHIKAKAKSRSGPWQTDEEEMYRKTPVKRLFKYLPIPETLEYAVQVDNVNETGRGRVDVPLLEVVQPPPEDTATGKLAAKLTRGTGRPKKKEPKPELQAKEDSPATAPTEAQAGPVGATEDEIDMIRSLAAQAGISEASICADQGVSAIEELDSESAGRVIVDLENILSPS